MSNATAADTTGLDMSGIFSPFFWGFFVSLFLGGITVVQAYIYFPHPNDRPLVQLTAAAMLVLDLVSSALVAQSLYYYLIPHFGSLSPLGSITPELSAECLISTVITFISQLYFVYQIYTVKHLGTLTWTVLGAITIFAFLAFLGGVGCVSAMYIYQHGVLSNRNSKFVIFFGLAKGFGALTDILATIAMCTFLSASKTGLNQTNGVIKSLIQFVIERGALVTLIQTLLLITFYAAPTRLYWLAFHINVTKLYANTFFSMLNARSYIKRQPYKSGMLSSSHGSNGFRARPTAQTYTVGSLNTQEHANEENVNDSYSMPTIKQSVDISEA